MVGEAVRVAYHRGEALLTPFLEAMVEDEDAEREEEEQICDAECGEDERAWF